MQTPVPPNSLRLNVGAFTTVVELVGPGASPQSWALPIGVDALWPASQRGEGPSALHVENAIQEVEDQIQRLHRCIPVGSRLVLAFDNWATMQRHGSIHRMADQRISLNDIEQEYQLLAARAVGAPSAAGSGFDDARGDALVLILRECMHHLGFDAVHIDG